MQTTTVQLLPTTTFGTPSGNYNGTSSFFAGDALKAADYYGGFGQLQTLAYFLNGFQGTITIQASLDAEPTTDEDWFTAFISTSSSPVTNSFPVNIRGNFTWVRAFVSDFQAGTITKLTMSY